MESIGISKRGMVHLLALRMAKLKKTEAEKKVDLILQLQIARGAVLDVEQILKNAIEDYREEVCPSGGNSTKHYGQK